MEKRVGLGPRLGAAVLDTVLGGVVAVVVLVIVATSGGVGMGLRYQEIIGGRISLGSFLDGTFVRQIQERSMELAREVEREFASRFTPEQADRMADIASEEMERMFVPWGLDDGGAWPTVQRILSINEDTLHEAVHRAFDAVEAAGIEGVSGQDLDAVHEDVDQIVEQLGIGVFLPEVVRYAIGVALAPLLGLLLYALVEAFVGASVGKLLLGIRIGDTQGRRDGMGITLLRFAVKSGGPLLAVIAVATRTPVLLAVAGVEYATMVLGALAILGTERRALHDLVVGTAVYRASDMEAA
jgi:uncharacterized RDD family membrane protein YckC